MKTPLFALALSAACVAPAEPPDEPLPVPFTVSDYYSPDGHYGDGEKEGAITLTRSCGSRPPGARGDCVNVTYKPGGRNFAGIIWQHPHNNWGDYRGHFIAPGATRITFFARGLHGNASLTVSAGQKDAAAAHSDSFKVEEKQVALGHDWAAFELPFFGAKYDGASGVIGAFNVSLPAAEDGSPSVIELDDIRWEK